MSGREITARERMWSQPMRMVKQRTGYDCAIAAAAMVTGYSYALVAAWFAKQHGDRFDAACRYAERVGGVTRDMRHSGSPWPPHPFAFRHLALVENPTAGHCVAMDEHGIVLDPLDGSITELTAWSVVNLVAGFSR